MAADADQKTEAPTPRRRQEAERQGADRLLDILQRLARVGAKSLLNKTLRDIEPAGMRAHCCRVDVRKLVNDLLLLGRPEPAELRDLNGDGLDLLGVQPRHQLRSSVLRQTHEEDRGFAKIGGHAIGIGCKS